MYTEFLDACVTGDLAKVQREINPEYHGVDFGDWRRETYYLGSILAYQHGHNHVAEWLQSQIPQNCNSDIFIDACRRGKLVLVKALYPVNTPSRSNYNWGVFDVLYKSVANVFNGTSEYDPGHDRTKGFLTACTHGHLTVAKWLYAKGGITITNEKDKYGECQTEIAFKLARMCNHTDVTEWLIQNGFDASKCTN